MFVVSSIPVVKIGISNFKYLPVPLIQKGKKALQIVWLPPFRDENPKVSFFLVIILVDISITGSEQYLLNCTKHQGNESIMCKSPNAPKVYCSGII